MNSRARFDWRTLRVRLTAWYILLLGLILLLFSAYLYVQFQRNLLAQLDAALEIAASQALGNVYDEGDTATFQNTESFRDMSSRLSETGFAVRLISPDGSVVDGFGDFRALPPWSGNVAYTTLEWNDVLWRLHAQPIAAEGRSLGWIQVGQPITVAEVAADSLLAQILIGLPLILLLAGGVGFFLADRALRPIDRMTRTAQSIGASGLNQRIGYRGPADEVGRLASTFDSMLDRLQAAFERERRFTADASHELRTPLTAIKGRLKVALDRPRSNQEYESALRDLDLEADRLIRLTTDLLFLSRLDRDRLNSEAHSLDFSEWLRAIVDQMRPLFVERNLELVEEIESNLVVYGDPDHLIRLFLNLLDNACKYTPPSGKVAVHAWRAGSNVFTSIRDTGEGIAPEHLPHLFERFYRVDASRTRDTGGAGLGLAIAHEIARWHGGAIEAQSQVGAGAEFTVRLPTQLAK